MTESFEYAMKTMRENLAGMYENGHMTKWADVDTSVDLDSIQAAHDRELARARDPQRLRGTRPNTFDGAIEALREFRWQHATNDEDAVPYINAVKEMHDRELERRTREQYSRGYEDGRRSMDARHYAVALRLQDLTFDGSSHENLSKIAYAIYPCPTGWTCESSKGLRDELVRLMGGVGKPLCSFAKSADFGKSESVGDDEVGKGCQINQTVTMYDELGTERQKAIAELRKLDSNDDKAYICSSEIAYAIGLDYGGTFLGRLIHLLGGDEPSLREVATKLGKVSVDAMSRRADQSHESSPMRQENETGITDELRECVNTATKAYDDTLWYELGDDSEADHTICHITEGELLRVADHIDEWFKRLCWQQEAVLQKTIEGIVDYDDLYAAAASFAGCDECGEYKQCMYQEFEKRVAVEQERDNLLDLLRDARDEYKMLDQMSAETSANFHAMRDRVWGLEAQRDELWAKLNDLRDVLDG